MVEDLNKPKSVPLLLPFLFFFPLYLYRVWKHKEYLMEKILLTVMLYFSPSVWGSFILLILGAISYGQHLEQQVQDSCNNEIAIPTDQGWGCVPFEDAMVFTDTIGTADTKAVAFILADWFENETLTLINNPAQIVYKNARYAAESESPWPDTTSQTYVITLTSEQSEAVHTALQSQCTDPINLCLLRSFPIHSDVWKEIVEPTVATEAYSSWIDETSTEEERKESLKYKQEEMDASLGWSSAEKKKVRPLEYRDGVVNIVQVEPNLPADTVLLSWKDTLMDPFNTEIGWFEEYPETPINVSVLYNNMEAPEFNVVNGDGLYVQQRNRWRFSALLLDKKTNMLWLTEESRLNDPG